MAATRRTKTKKPTKRTVRYEKGQKIQGFLLLDKTPTRSPAKSRKFCEYLHDLHLVSFGKGR